MKLTYRWPILLAYLVLAGVSTWLWSLPFAHVVEGPLPDPIAEHYVLLEPGVVLRQTLTLPSPAPRDIAVRLWVQRVPAQQPFLRIRGESAGRVLGIAMVPLAAADGAFHVRQAPWWQVPVGAQQLTLVIEGHGMHVAATAVDRIAGGDLEINNSSPAPGDLALQLVSGDLGIERYLPLTRIVEGKPGILAWVRYPLVLFLLYLAAAITLLRSPLRLLRRLEDTPDFPTVPATEDRTTP
jgi:hypothetical protein